MPLVILEGLTGAGKSSTLAALVQQLQAQSAELQIVYEEETFGELMAEMAIRKENPCHRLQTILARLQTDTAGAQPKKWLLLERFHPSYYALLPDWSLYQAIDQQLAALGARLVLLGYPAEALASRALYRMEREAEGWSQGFLALYGSEALALAALETSRCQRIEACQLSALTCLEIDTSQQIWDVYATRILDWAGTLA